MAKIINISDKLSTDKPVITVGDDKYPVNDSLETVMKFEEMYQDGDTQAMLECLKLALGEEAAEKLKFEGMSFTNIRVWFFAVMAAMQDMDYDEVEDRFHKFTETAQ